MGYRIQMVGAQAAGRTGRYGRHRLGHPGLNYCRQLPTVRSRLDVGPITRHAAPISPAQLSIHVVSLILLAVIAGTVLVSGWYAAAGAAVIADIVTP
jgi:hypothetical protein